MIKVFVSDRVMLLGLQQMYREDMKRNEVQRLLPCARAVAKALAVSASTERIEGYYTESAELTEYFGLMRALQATDKNRLSEVNQMPTFGCLSQVCSSKVFGYKKNDSMLLPVGHDSLTEALQQTTGSWEMTDVINVAAKVSAANEDCSLVGLAARINDAVCLTASRESVVLYAEVPLTADELVFDEVTYEWNVSKDLCENTERFINEYAKLFKSQLPEPKPENAEKYHSAYSENKIEGRCVRVGTDILSTPTRYWHWKIDKMEDGSLEAGDFWSEEIWTTEMYQNKLRQERISKVKHRKK